MRPVVLGLCSALAVTALGAGASAEQHRVALVIGNGAYTETAPLANPPNDANDMADALEGLGFNVIKVVDGDRSRIEQGIATFGRLAEDAKVAVFFYAGHGLQVAGKNYIVPTMAKLVEEKDLESEVIDVERVLGDMNWSGAAVKIVILDSCRDNPLARNLARSVRATGRSMVLGKGLAELRSAEGMLVAYATGPGAIAADGVGRNSPFTAALLKWIVEPGLEVGQMFRRVRRDVVRQTGENQRPWVHESLLGDFYFAGAAGRPPVRPHLSPRRPDEPFRDCADCPEMVVIPAGSFTMGSPDREDGRYDDEGPWHRVTIPRPFALGKYEVTWAEFAAFARDTGHDPRGCYVDDTSKRRSRLEPHFRAKRKYGSSPSRRSQGNWIPVGEKGWRDPNFTQSERDPVVCVSWDDAQDYVRWLGEKTGREFRLPSEAEWEYAVRAGTTTARYWGDGPDRACGHGNFHDQTGRSGSDNRAKRHDCRDGYDRTAPVGNFSANGFGLHDMLGNVLEWVRDCYTDSYSLAPRDGSAWTGGDCGYHVLRGGSWTSTPSFARAALRGKNLTGLRLNFVGFRMAMTLR